MLFIDLEVSFVWYSCYNVVVEGEILDLLIFDGCILLYSDTNMHELVIRSSVSGWEFNKSFDGCTSNENDLKFLMCNDSGAVHIKVFHLFCRY